MKNNTILEPMRLYESEIKENVKVECEKYLDELIKTSKTDEVLNKDTVAKYNIANSEAEKAKGKLGNQKFLKGFLIVLGVLGLVMGVIFTIGAIQPENNLALNLPLAILGYVITIVMFALAFSVVSKNIKAQQSRVDKLVDKANKLLDMCWAQTSDLCSLFDWNIPAKITRKAAPLIQLDDYLDNKKFDLLQKHYGLLDIDDKDTSTVMVLSGTIADNPFMMVRNLHRYDDVATYTGSIVITWQERHTDSEGHTSYVTRTQTLIATVTKPCPGYENLTYLVYGNMSAPDLVFKRSSTGLGVSPEPKEVEKFVSKREKELEKYADKALKKGTSFTPMNNTRFEALWGAWDRNNEVDYRVLFDTLSQQNECDLITKNPYFGDDFYFEKRNKLNFVVSSHSQKADYEVDPRQFFHYDVEVIKERFNTKINEFFKNLYFDLAPVISIIPYQTVKPLPYMLRNDYETNFSSYENEVMANAMPGAMFQSPLSETQQILKSTKVKMAGKTDKVVIKSHAYRTETRVDFIPKMGGDGRMHEVPVEWKEYIPIENEKLMAIKAFDHSKNEFDHKMETIGKDYRGDGSIQDEITYKRGLMGFLISDDFDDTDDIELDKVFGLDIN